MWEVGPLPNPCCCVLLHSLWPQPHWPRPPGPPLSLWLPPFYCRIKLFQKPVRDLPEPAGFTGWDWSVVLSPGPNPVPLLSATACPSPDLVRYSTLNSEHFPQPTQQIKNIVRQCQQPPRKGRSEALRSALSHHASISLPPSPLGQYHYQASTMYQANGQPLGTESGLAAVFTDSTAEPSPTRGRSCCSLSVLGDNGNAWILSGFSFVKVGGKGRSFLREELRLGRGNSVSNSCRKDGGRMFVKRPDPHEEALMILKGQMSHQVPSSSTQVRAWDWKQRPNGASGGNHRPSQTLLCTFMEPICCLEHSLWGGSGAQRGRGPGEAGDQCSKTGTHSR